MILFLGKNPQWFLFAKKQTKKIMLQFIKFLLIHLPLLECELQWLGCSGIMSQRVKLIDTNYITLCK